MRCAEPQESTREEAACAKPTRRVTWMLAIAAIIMLAAASWQLVHSPETIGIRPERTNPRRPAPRLGATCLGRTCAPASALDAHRAMSIEHDDAIEIQRWRKYALNVLLLPMIEAREPWRWAGENLLKACTSPNNVTVDGAAPAAGALLPREQFHVHWKSAECLDLGPRLTLRGTLDMQVRVGERTLQGWVTSPDLVASVDGHSYPLPPFTATVSMIPAAPGD